MNIPDKLENNANILTQETIEEGAAFTNEGAPEPPTEAIPQSGDPSISTAAASSLLKAAAPKLSSFLPRPRNVRAYSTSQLSFDSTFFRLVLFGETNMRKTTIAATLGSPDSTLIVNTRASEQMLPLRGKGYQILDVQDAAGLRYGLLNAFSEWSLRQKDNPSLGGLKTLILDDATEGVQLLLEEGDSKDNRKNYNEAGKELRSILTSLRYKPLNLCIVALAKNKENLITNKDKVSFELPPSMLNMISAEMEFAFYIMPETYKLLTERDWLTFKDDSDGKEKTYRVEIFAKSKFPQEMTKTLAKYEEPNLAAIWKKIQTAVSNNQSVTPSSSIASAKPVSRFASAGVKK